MRHMIADNLNLLGAVEAGARTMAFKSKAGKMVENAAMRKFKHEQTREDELEMPILRALQVLAGKRLSRQGMASEEISAEAPAAGAASLRDLF